MLAILLILILLAVAFGGLALFVARIFLIGLLIALLVGLVAGYAGRSRRA
jgi:hypothetical protein